MRNIKKIFYNFLYRTKVKRLCFLSAMLGYQYTVEWIVDNVPEAGYLVGDYLEKNPEKQDEIAKKYIKDADHIFDKALEKYKQLKLLDEYGFDPDDIKAMEGR